MNLNEVYELVVKIGLNL